MQNGSARRDRALFLAAIVSAILLSLLLLRDVAALAGRLQSSTTSAAPVEIASSAPTIDLNGPDPGSGYSTTFTENAGPKLIVSSSLIVSDTDSSTIKSATVTLTNRPDGNAESLEIDDTLTNISASYNPDSGVLKLSSTETISDYQTVLRTVTYNNISDAPATEDRLVTFQVYDGSNYSVEATSTIAINAVNDAPILDNRGDMRFSTIDEDATNQIGNLVKSVIESAETGGQDRITDPDTSFDAISLEGIAVIEVGEGNGDWQYSTNAGTSWQDFGVVANSMATLLNLTARIRFLPHKNYYGPASITFRAWDQTSGSSGETGVDVSVNGGSSAFSLATEAASIDVLPVNDPPMIDLNGIISGTNLITNYAGGSGPVPVVAPDATIEDFDNNEIVSAVVTLTTRPDGESELLAINGDASPITVYPYNPVSGELRLTGAASLELYASVLRKITYDNLSPKPNVQNRIIEFVISDGLDNSPIATTTLLVNPSNNAPQIDPKAQMSFSDVVEDETDPPGNSVGFLIASDGSDPIQDDDVGALRGFAIVGKDSNDGKWQFSIDDGLNWSMIGVISDTAAILVNTSAIIRFVPDADASGFQRSITVRAWDQTAGVNGSQGIDVSQNGGLSAYSSNTVQIWVNVSELNDAPVLELPDNITAVFTEHNGPVIIAGPSLRVRDIDSPNLKSAKVNIENHQANTADFLAATTNGSGLTASYDADAGSLLFSGSASVAEYQAVLRTVTFENRSHDPIIHDRVVTLIVNDGLAYSNLVTSTVKMESVNDLPLIDLSGGEIPGTNVNVQFDKSHWGGDPLHISEDLEILDLDDSSLMSATVTLTNQPDGQSEHLAVDTSGTNITALYEQQSGQLELTGMDSLASYEQVLSTITYSNLRERPQTDDRLVNFIVFDHKGAGNLATSRIVVTPKFIFLPAVAGRPIPIPESDEPNNVCAQAFSVATNVLHEFLPDDRDDWYSFELDKSGDVIVQLTNFTPEDGQILVAQGQCETLTLLGQNGDYAVSKTVDLGNLLAGRYFIWLITDKVPSPDTIAPYELMVKVN